MTRVSHKKKHLAFGKAFGFSSIAKRWQVAENKYDVHEMPDFVKVQFAFNRKSITQRTKYLVGRENEWFSISNTRKCEKLHPMVGISFTTQSKFYKHFT